MLGVDKVRQASSIGTQCSNQPYLLELDCHMPACPSPTGTELKYPACWLLVTCTQYQRSTDLFIESHNRPKCRLTRVNQIGMVILDLLQFQNVNLLVIRSFSPSTIHVAEIVHFAEVQKQMLSLLKELYPRICSASNGNYMSTNSSTFHLESTN